MSQTDNKEDTAAVKQESTAKRDALRAIEKDIQALWEAEKIFEVDAGEEGEEKYMATFPYPYTNGRLHLGHVFTLTKSEFAVGYQRLKGKRAIFPFGFHATGMPIKVGADRLAREIANESAATTTEALAQVSIQEATPAAKVDPTAFRSKKSKAVSKGAAGTQWNLMRSMLIPDEEIPEFADAQHWLRYFPQHIITDLKSMGANIDWRRSFVTTDINPYYDMFVRWQFETLKKLEKVKFGYRLTIYSPLDGQACADHDRSIGEGVMPVEYTGIKLELLSPYPPALASLEGKKVFLIAATLRPETMYGQTNVWVGPELEYGAFEAVNDEIFVINDRAALNLAYQGFTKEKGKVVKVGAFKGVDLIGAALKAPLTSYEKIHVLPMMNVLATMGTSVVTCVPSDSPDDFTSLRDLKEKPALREKFGVKDEHVLPYDAIPIIRTAEFGDLSAKFVCEQLKIKSQNDKVLLADAHDKVYKAGFYSGELLVGPYAGQKVLDAKAAIKEELLKAGVAIPYYEPERRVVSRSGDECVVAPTDQWYENYGEAEWKELTGKALDKLQVFSAEARNSFQHVLNWLGPWACSRSFGLGSRLPWDDRWLIESLSDSTIYMAYYTIAHFLHTDLYGRDVGPAGITAAQMTTEVWDHIFLDGPYPASSGISEETFAKLRKEFNYWYPFDLRVSGKELIQNHLTMCLYNHTAFFPENKWPKAMRVNGHLLLNNQKMSKSSGTFLLLHETIQQYGADGMRFALADAGDGMDDANFTEVAATTGIRRLHTQLLWTQDTVRDLNKLRTGEYNLWDQIFESQINQAIILTDKAYEGTSYKEALKAGFFDLQTARDNYRSNCGATPDHPDATHRDLIVRFIEVQAILLAPITPHFCEHIWRNLLQKEGSVLKAKWPQAGPIDTLVLRKNDYLASHLYNFRLKHKALLVKPKKAAADWVPPVLTTASVYVTREYPDWQPKATEILKEIYLKHGEIPEKDLGSNFKNTPDLAKQMKKIMALAGELRTEAVTRGADAFELKMPFDEQELLTSLADYLARQLTVGKVVVLDAADPATADLSGAKAAAAPGKPSIAFA